MSQTASVSHSVDSEGIAWIVFDEPAARANVFNPASLAGLRASLAAVTNGNGPKTKAVVLTSAKETIFLAGADLRWLAALPDAAAATAAAREGQAVFDLLANCPVPVVCAIHGACAGGGYELALACTRRLASAAPETRIGLPEVSLGLLPAWGGCARLPRLIGAQRAVEIILNSSLLPAPAAREAGLVDEIVPVSELKARARAVALELAGHGTQPRPTPLPPSPDFFQEQRRLAPTRWPGRPAALAVLEAVENALALPLPQGLEIEANLFGRLASGSVAKNLLHAFRLKEQARKRTLDAWFPGVAAGPGATPFRTVGIVGAGVMGSGIAHWCAMHGYGVILCDSNRQAIERGVAVIRELFADGVARGKVTPDAAHRMTGGIGITTSLEDFEYCDLVIETIVEDRAAKQKVFAELSALTRPECVLATNTSAIPIEELAAGVAQPGRVVGLHFFNLVSRMKLVELVLGAQTNRATAVRVLEFVRSVGKTAVVCRSSPGHFTTRAIFFCLNEACRLWEQGIGTEAIDGAMRDWGWRMGPLRQMDEIGMQATLAVFAQFAHYFPERFAPTAICARFLAAGLEGRQNGASTGFYEYENGTERPNPAAAEFASKAAPHPALSAEEIRTRLNGVLRDEMNRALAEGVVKSPDDADLALLLGAGYPAYRGGLLRSAAESTE